MSALTDFGESSRIQFDTSYSKKKYNNYDFDDINCEYTTWLAVILFVFKNLYKLDVKWTKKMLCFFARFNHCSFQPVKVIFYLLLGENSETVQDTLMIDVHLWFVPWRKCIASIIGFELLAPASCLSGPGLRALPLEIVLRVQPHQPAVFLVPQTSGLFRRLKSFRCGSIPLIDLFNKKFLPHFLTYPLHSHPRSRHIMRMTVSCRHNSY